MPRRIHFYDPPQRFVAGTVGPPGQRTFFLQARDDSQITSVVLEKVQVELLAQKIDEMLDDLATEQTAVEIPPAPTAEEADTDPLEQPIVEEFRVGNLRLGWHEDEGVVVIEAFSAEDPPPDPLAEAAGQQDATQAPDPAGPASQPGAAGGAEPDDLLGDPDDRRRELLLVRLTPKQARGFAQRAALLVAAGRPPCPFCAQPLDPEGHVCPRQNGYARRR